MLRVAHDANDLKRSARKADSNRFPKRILSRKGFASQHFVNDRDLLVLVYLLGGEEPASQEWNAHDVEMIPSDYICIRNSQLVVRGRCISAAESVGRRPHKGKSAHLDARGFDTGQAAEPIVQSAKPLPDTFGSRKLLG